MSATRFVSRIMAVMRELEAAKKYASPTQWAQVHEVQSRLATALGLRRATNKRRRERKKRKRRAKKEG